MDRLRLWERLFLSLAQPQARVPPGGRACSSAFAPVTRQSADRTRSPVPVEIRDRTGWVWRPAFPTGAVRVPARGDRAAQMGEDLAYRRAVGDEGDDPHLAAAPGTHQRKHLVDSGDEHGPNQTCGFPMKRFVHIVIPCDRLHFRGGEARLGFRLRQRRHHRQRRELAPARRRNDTGAGTVAESAPPGGQAVPSVSAPG